MSQHLPNDLWYRIYSKQWSSAEESLRRDAGQASSIGFVNGVTKANQRYLYNGRNYNDGECPLSTALRMKAPESLILALLKAKASAASVKDKGGLLPIHLAFSGGYSDELLVVFFLGSDDNSFPNFSAELEARLMSLISAKKQQILSMKNQDGSVLLHVVISHGYSLELIRAVVLGYKNALGEANLKGFLPLHVAVDSNRGDDIICYLLGENERATAIATNSGELPIHIAIRKSANAELINGLLDSFEGGARIKDRSGDLPIHIAIKNKFGAGIVSRLLKLYPECLVEPGAKGLVPLVLVIQLNASDDVVLVILESYPTLKRVTNYTALQQEVGKFRRLPLHNAILFGASTLTTLDMIKNYPAAATKSDDSNIDGELPIHLALQQGRSEEVVVALLIAYPDSLERCKPMNMKKLHPVVRAAFSRPIDYWEAKSLSMLSDVMSELRAEATGIQGTASDYQLVERNVLLNEVDAFRNVADDAQLKLWDEIINLKKAITQTGESNATDIDELRRAFLDFKTRMNEKVDLLERGTIIAVERLVGSDETTDSTGDY